LEFAKKVYNFASTEFMTFGSEKNKDAVDLRFGLIAFAARGMFEKNSGHPALHVELPKRVYIWRFEVHPFSTQASPQLFRELQRRNSGCNQYICLVLPPSSAGSASFSWLMAMLALLAQCFKLR